MYKDENLNQIQEYLCWAFSVFSCIPSKNLFPAKYKTLWPEMKAEWLSYADPDKKNIINPSPAQVERAEVILSWLHCIPSGKINIIRDRRAVRIATMRCARFDYEKISKMLNREVSARTARRIHTHSLERIRDKVYLKAIEESKKNTGLDGLYMPIDLDMIGEVTPPSMLIIQPINSYA